MDSLVICATNEAGLKASPDYNNCVINAGRHVGSP
jgi:hypothetical protein